MGPDIRDRLKDAALEPSFDVDVDRLHQRARRNHVRNVATTGVLSVVALVVGAVVVVSMFGSPDPVPPVVGPGGQTENQAGSPDDLLDRSFVSVAVYEDGEERKLVGHRGEETYARVGFGRHEGVTQVGWSVGCNSMSAPVDIGPDRLQIGSVFSTLIGCPDGLREEESWLGRFFRSSPRWEFDGDLLRLSSNGVIIELEPDPEGDGGRILVDSDVDAEERETAAEQARQRLEERAREARREVQEFRRQIEEARAVNAAHWQPGSDADEEMMARLVAIASDHSADPDLPLAAEVALGLGSELYVTRSREQLTDPLERARAWLVDVDEFRGHDGPFSALNLAADAQDWDRVAVTVGDHPHCSASPTPTPAAVSNLRRVNLHPTADSIDSCHDWWMISLYVTDAGEITAATLDVWER